VTEGAIPQSPAEFTADNAEGAEREAVTTKTEGQEVGLTCGCTYGLVGLFANTVTHGPMWKEVLGQDNRMNPAGAGSPTRGMRAIP